VRTATVRPVPYPPRPQLRPRPAFAGTASPRPDPAVQARVELSIVEHHLAGRSLRELSELTNRSFSAIRNLLSRHGVYRREAGAAPLHADAASDSPAPSDAANSLLAGHAGYSGPR
jgi:hypothetical protein